MRELPRDLVLILRTEAKNQRTPPIDYVIAEDGGRMVHRPEPDIAMAELLEEAAAALATERAAHAETRRALDGVIEACNHTEAQALGVAVDLKTTEAALEAALRAAPAAEPVASVLEQAAHVELGLACREPDVSDATRELIRRVRDLAAPPAPVADGFAVAVAWHTARAKHTPDVFEQELHQKSAAAIRALGTGTPLDEAGLAALDATRFAPVADGERDRYRRAAEFAAKMAWREDPPNAHQKLTDSERLSAIKHHPDIKALAAAPTEAGR